MGAFTFLSDWQVKNWRTVEHDKDCNDLLQEIRSKTCEEWLIATREYEIPQSWGEWLQGKPVKHAINYTLYCHVGSGEFQVINLVTRGGGSIFHGSFGGGQDNSREHVMNFMLGMLCGFHGAERAAAPAKEAA